MSLILEQNVHVTSKSKVGRNIQGALMKSEDLGLLGGSVQPRPGTLEVDVNVLKTRKHLNELSRVIYYDYVAMLDHRGGKINFSEDSFISYVESIFLYRVKYVRENDSNYRKIFREAFLPHLLASVLSTIGEAYLDDYGIALRPSLEGLEFKPLTAFEILEFSSNLKLLARSFNLSMAEELPKDKSGDALVMSFNYSVGEAVKAPDMRRHPSQAIAALICEVCLPQTYLVPRIKYIDSEAVDYVIRLVAKFENLGVIK